MKRERRLTKRERKDLAEGAKILQQYADAGGDHGTLRAALLYAEFEDWVRGGKR